MRGLFHRLPRPPRRCFWRSNPHPIRPSGTAAPITAHLVALLDHYGAPHPGADATHYYGEMGKYWLKWEQHTEFVTYTVFSQDVSDRPFDPVGV